MIIPAKEVIHNLNVISIMNGFITIKIIYIIYSSNLAKQINLD